MRICGYNAWNVGAKQKLTDALAVDLRWYDTDSHELLDARLGDYHHGELTLGAGLFGVADALDHVQGGKAAGTRDQVGECHQVRVVPAIEEQLSGCGKFGEYMQPLPLHSMPLGPVCTRPPAEWRRFWLSIGREH